MNEVGSREKFGSEVRRLGGIEISVNEPAARLTKKDADVLPIREPSRQVCFREPQIRPILLARRLLAVRVGITAHPRWR